MANHPTPGWRRSVGPQWSSVKQHGTGSVPPPAMQQGFHTSYLNAISRPDLNHDYQQQQQQLEQPRQQLQQQQQPTPPSSNPSSRATRITTEHQRALLQHEENQKQQQHYIQQLQLMQRLQAMPGSTTRPWYPTFGPAITTSCSDSTIQLDNPSQYTLINNAKLNRQAVGPHWRSIQTSSTFSPTPSPPSSSPLLQTQTLTQSLSDFSSASSTSSTLSLSAASTTTALHSFLSSTYSSPASIDHVRATSFRQLDQEMASSTESRLSLTQPVQEDYYQSHSYPHDPHHHPQNNRPENSREARDSMPLTNRASPIMPRMTHVSQMTTQSTKRKASWQDRVDENDEGEEEDSRQGYEDRSQSLAAQSSIQQFVPTADPQSMVRPDQDQEMSNAETGVSTTNVTSTSTSTSSCMSMETSSMDQELIDATNVLYRTEIGPVRNGSKPLAKRTKPRLDPTMYEIMSVAELRRSQGDEQMQDIFQECFYNAAASSRS
ncbi:hypothetical protein BGZ50_000116 [Haplosporangium sp. Z 11]|nr:hypothetical protein BGZ50_000116 [Haplosporangium sp. Z 11]